MGLLSDSAAAISCAETIRSENFYRNQQKISVAFQPRRFSDRRGAFFVSARRKTKNSPARTRYNALNFKRLIHLYLIKSCANLPRFCAFYAVRLRMPANTDLPRLLRRRVQNGRISRVARQFSARRFYLHKSAPYLKPCPELVKNRRA